MENLFNLSDDKLREVIAAYDTWVISNKKEAEYIGKQKKLNEEITRDFLDADIISQMNDDVFYDRIYKYSRKLEGPVSIRLGEPRLRAFLPSLRRNLLYLLKSNDTPFVKAEKIIEGEYKIVFLAKAFWSPILQARFPDVLPNWNNKTENFLRKLGVDIKSPGLSISQKYKILSEAFIYLCRLSDGHDFYTINHLMHYGTAIKEGSDLVARLQGKSISDPVLEMIRSYKDFIKNSKLENELYKWRLIKKYVGRPDTNAADFSNEVKNLDFKNLVFHNAIVVRNHIASEMPEEYRACFVKLFKDQDDLTMRVKEFASNILAIYRKLEPSLSSHHDERTISAFLTYHNPLRYTFFKDSYYQKYCRLIGIESKPKGEKYGHFMQLLNNLVDNYIVKDSELLTLVRSFMDSDCFEDPNHLVLAQDMLFNILDKDEEEIEEQAESDSSVYEKISTKSSEMALNTILYGPPGTGKTYNTVDLAVKIAAPDKYQEGNHEANKLIYDGLIQSGQITFTTFHQSLSYEDFIEGIKPTSDENSTLSYSVEDGLFKKIAVNAGFEFVGTETSEASKSLSFSFAYDQLLDEVTEKIGRGEGYKLKLRSGGDLEIIEISTGSNFLVQHTNGSRTYTVSRKRLEKLFSQLPDLDSISNINEEFRKIIGGSNSSAYWAVLKKIRSLKRETHLAGADKEYSYEDKAIAVEKLQPEDLKTHVPVKNYVLIIDEINRGNVSQVFGELITLIEDDKRYGRPEGLSAILPYSRSRFFVPPNLYLIGTMNTADRSVEALDTALRRRFSFMEMTPRYNLEGMDKELAGVKIADLLETINNRIEKLVDKDHMIGHSYFLGIDNAEILMGVFKNKVIPLLQEYFYGNYEKMGLVLGKGFIEKLPDEKVKFASFPADSNDYNDKVIYRIRTIALNNNDEFMEAISLLMNK